MVSRSPRPVPAGLAHKSKRGQVAEVGPVRSAGSDKAEAPHMASHDYDQGRKINLSNNLDESEYGYRSG